MCKPRGEAGIPAECPRRGDCRGCPGFIVQDGEPEDRRPAPDPAAKRAQALGPPGLH
ncbi:hypothetical protein ABID08_000652 [Rhizobium binae]|uniref:Oxidoreductase n=1 Tax=Rhizobium binae TaxID=1138190 RepID=A0ABV2MD51_9HYPH